VGDGLQGVGAEFLEVDLGVELGVEFANDGDVVACGRGGRGSSPARPKRRGGCGASYLE